MAKNYLCQVCSAPIPAIRFRQFKTCKKHACRVAAARNMWIEKRNQEEARQQELLATRRKVAAAASTFVTRAGRNLSGKTMAFVPANVRRISNLPARRVRAFRDHLLLGVSEAAAQQASNKQPTEPQPADPLPAEADLLGSGCATCQGRCCEKGYNRAFLTAEEFLRFMRNNRALRPREVVAAYLARIPQRTYHDSCVYHAEDGCALPREMRSQICNRFLCGPLKELQTKPRETGSKRFLIVAADGDTFIRAAEVDGQEGAWPLLKRIE